MNSSGHARSGWIRFASLAASVALFIAPFRSSAGWRASLLVLAAVAIVVHARRRGERHPLLPPDRPLRIAVVAWFLAACAWSFVGPAPLDALESVKGDIVMPVIAFGVFFALTRDRADLLRWVAVLLVGLLVLTGMAVREPFDPVATSHNPAYGNVGWLSTWLVTLAPLLVVLLYPPPAMRSMRFTLWGMRGVAVLCLAIAAWESGSRTVWACFAVMLGVAVVGGTLGPAASGRRLRVVLTAMILLLVSVGMMWDSMRHRADVAPPGARDPIGYVFQDNRIPIWQEALAMIREHPLRGRGYANPELPDAFAGRFTDPWFRQMFRHPHNVVLSHALQMGIAGAVVVLGVFGALAAAFMRRARARGLARLAGLCGVALVLGVLLRNSTDDFFARHGVLLFGAVAGMLAGLGTRRPPPVARVPGTASDPPQTTTQADRRSPP